VPEVDRVTFVEKGTEPYFPLGSIVEHPNKAGPGLWKVIRTHPGTRDGERVAELVMLSTPSDAERSRARRWHPETHRWEHISTGSR
jgi:hypothetical protein